ncbi:Ig-like domain-containing protein [Micromonospora sp. DT81.3]|uniref:Ig-like domain-containing protein n=1 Tax=Micromonospora sp. DT81.3 TaxID=3416523 RepID=UPI003CF58568
MFSLGQTWRGKSLFALLLALALPAAVASPLAAVASPAEPDTVSAASPAERDTALEFSLGTPLGGGERRSFGDLSTRRILFGADTTRLVFATDLVAIGPVHCAVYSSAGTIAQRSWSPEEWDAAADRVLDVPAGSTGPGKFPEATCATGVHPVENTDRWNLIGVAAAGPTVILTADVSLLDFSWSSAAYENRTRPNAYPGQRILVTGPPGTWTGTGTMDPDNARYGAQLALSGHPDKYDVDMPVEVSPDGATVSVTLPNELPAEYFGDSPAGLAIFFENLVQNTPESPGRSESVDWYAILDIADQRVSTTLTMNRTVTLPRLPIRATAVVDTASTGGTVTFTVDDKTVKAVRFSTATNGTVTTTLPSLPRGTHVVRAVYSGAGAVGGSESLPVTLRILG